MTSNSIPNSEQQKLFNYLAAEVYRDPGETSGDGYEYRKIGDLFTGWSELKIDNQGQINLGENGNIINIESDIWSPLRAQGYDLPEAEEVFARVSVNETTKEAVIAFRGTDQHLEIDSFGNINSDWDDNLLGFGTGATTGQVYATFVMGDYFLNLLQSEGYSVQLTGHSKDGGFSAVYGAARGLDVFTVNAAPAENLLPSVLNGLNEYTRTIEHYNYGPETIKLWPSIAESANAISDGSNIYNYITPGDILNTYLHETAGMDYIGSVNYATDSQNNIFVPDPDGSGVSYHSPTLALLLNLESQLITISQDLPGFSNALFSNTSARLQSTPLESGNSMSLVTELVHDSINGGGITDALINDAQNLTALVQTNAYYQLGTHLNAITNAIVQHARNQLDAN